MSIGYPRIAQAVAAMLAVTSLYSVAAIAQEATASGEVRRVNVTEGKIAIRHGKIPELELIAMTLVYRIDPVLLVGIEPGDKVKFKVRRDAGQYVIVAISK